MRRQTADGRRQLIEIRPSIGGRGPAAEQRVGGAATPNGAEPLAPLAPPLTGGASNLTSWT